MRLRHELAVSLAVQSAGAASVLLATVWLGVALGPQVQGAFSRAKSELEFIGAFAAFGLPQALFFHLRSGRIGLATALRWAGGATALALPIGLLAAFGFEPAEGGLAVLLAGVAVMAFVAQGQLRSLLLVRDRATRFNLATAAPQVLTLAGVGLIVVLAAPLREAGRAPGALHWFAVFAIAYGATAFVAWRGLPGGKRVPVSRAPTPPPASSETTDAAGADAPTRPLVRSLLHYGLAAWLTAALATAAILAVQRWVEDAAGRAALGRFTMAMTLTQVPLTPIGYAAPLLFRRWIHGSGAGPARRWAAALFGGLLGIAALVAIASRWVGDLGLGPAYAGTTRALALLLVGGAAEAASRVLAVQTNAVGLPWVAVRAEASRAAVLALAWLALPAPTEALTICAAWSAAAIASAAVLVWHGRPGRRDGDARAPLAAGPG